MTASNSPPQQRASPMKMYYVDDSGAENTGFVVYSWIEITPDAWNTGLRHWLDMRKDLYASYQVPPSAELHATKLQNGRTTPSTNDAVNNSKQALRNIMETALESICTSRALRVGTVYRRTSQRGRNYNVQRQQLYVALVDRLEKHLETSGGLGMIFMDGSGSDPSYKHAHRDLKLADRRIVEDPLFQGSHLSQWVQMADLVAWTTYQSLLRNAGKKWCWDWYDRYLAGCDVNGAPVEL